MKNSKLRRNKISIEVGDFINFDPRNRVWVTKSALYKSRLLACLRSIALLLILVKKMKEIELPYTLQFFYF